MDQRITSRSKQHTGFTLVELLVVMLIVAMIAGVVVLNMPPPRGSQKNDAEIFAARLNAAAEIAIMTGALIGLEIDPSGYRYYHYIDGSWTEHGDRALRSGTFPDDMSVEFLVADTSLENEQSTTDSNDEADELPAPTIFISPTGDTTPLTAKFTSRRHSIEVTLDMAGHVSVDGR